MAPSPGSHDGPASGTASHRVSVSSMTSGPHPPTGEAGGSKPGSVHRDGGGGLTQGLPRESVITAVLTATNRISRIVRTQAPPQPQPQPESQREGSPERLESPRVAPAEVTTTEHIEPAAPGSTLGGPYRDDSLDLVVGQVPPFDLEASRVGAGGRGPEQALADYSAAAERWLLTEANLEQYEEFMARGLLMVRNLARCDGRHVIQPQHGWVGLVRDCLAARQPLVRAAAANCVAALATSGSGRDAILKDALIVSRTVQMLKNGLAVGGDNSDTQYAALALANMSLVAGLRQPLLSQGALGAAAEVLRVAGRWFGPQQQAPTQPSMPAGRSGSHCGTGPVSGSAAAVPLAVPAPGDRYARGTDSSGVMGTSPGGGMLGSGGHGNGGANTAAGRKAVQRAAVYITTLLTCIAVDNSGRDQMQMAGIPRLAAELHERCAAAAGAPGGLGADSLLSRRLALLAEATTTAELMEDLLEAGVGGSSGAGWDAIEESYTGINGRMSRSSTQNHGDRAGALSRGVSFVEAGGKVTRAAAALTALQRLVDPETARKDGGGGALNSHQTTQRALSRKQSLAANALDAPLAPPSPSVTFSGATSPPRTSFSDVASVSRRALITPPPPGLAISAGHLGSSATPQPPSPTPPTAGNLGALLRNELGGGSLTRQTRSGSESGVPGGMLGVHFSAAVFNDGQGGAGAGASNGGGVGADDVSSPFRRSHTTHLANPATGGTGPPKSAVRLPHVVGFGSSAPRSNNNTSNGGGAGHTTISHHHGHGQLQPHPPPQSPALMSAGLGPGSPMRPVPPNTLPPSSHSHHDGMHVEDFAGSPPGCSPASMNASPHGAGSGMMLAPSPPCRPRSSAAVSVASARGGGAASMQELSRRMTNTKLNGHEYGSGSSNNSAATAAAALGSCGGGLYSGGGALVPTGTRSGCNSPLPLSRQPSQARLELPFHLVRATTPSSTSSGGKMSRIAAAYGSVGSRAGSITSFGGTGVGTAGGFSRMYTSEL
ncbi:hypothetical protein HYH02_003931 [Chlamydomonas schloesseri]|uniref:Uncharacterized protein n=1 Tax=Chlamydomonas schloesseri TaxID=2026947 RepID=A0A836B900_9CHLO|nr:hypothetical protein HYH02_003931 [Chlamydomonas schloesseri]|eukprot:KAG2451326.1 hypothetical protein HYH02_003931 [Chlamydomonas schloesseri]